MTKINTYSDFYKATAKAHSFKQLFADAFDADVQWPSKIYEFRAYEGSTMEVRSEESFSITNYPIESWSAGGEVIHNTDRGVSIDGPWWDDLAKIVNEFSAEVYEKLPAAQKAREERDALAAKKRLEETLKEQEKLAAANKKRIMDAIKAAQEATEPK